MRLRPLGFSLIEATVALGILSAIVGAILGAFPTAYRTVGSSRTTTVAATLIQAKLEALRQVAYADLTVGAYEGPQRVDASPDDPFYGYTRSVTVTAVDDNLNQSASDTGLKKVTVTVAWTDPQRGDRSASISTMVTAY